MEAFITFLKQYIHLSEEAENVILDMALEETIDKGALLSQQGKTCKRIYFLYKGTVRTYFYKNGNDITHWIYPKENMVTSWYSYLSQTPSKDYIEATENCHIISLTYNQWQELYAKFPELERFGRLFIEEQMALIDDFYKGYFFLTAKEKYQLLTQVYADITLRANLGHIASMLGISQETLSRIRK